MTPQDAVQVAEELSQDEVQETVDKAENILKKAESGLSKVRSDLIDLLTLARAYVTGEYRYIPWASMVAIVSALVYLVNPVDLIPDAIPGAGLTDDASVIAFVTGVVKHEIERYKKFVGTPVEVETI